MRWFDRRRLAIASAVVLLTSSAYADPVDDYVKQGRDALSRMEPDAAVHAFDLALKSDPSHAEAAFWRGGTLLKLKKFSDAIIDLDKAVAAGPANPFYGLALLKRCEAKIALKIIDGGRQDCESALQVATPEQRVLIDEILDKAK
jgi:tetratricopeptide (TPR) repeat protein